MVKHVVESAGSLSQRINVVKLVIEMVLSYAIWTGVRFPSPPRQPDSMMPRFGPRAIADRTIVFLRT